LHAQAAARLSANATAADRTEWVALNASLHDDERTLEWFAQANSDPAVKDQLASVGHHIEMLLIERARWGEVALLYPDPMAFIAEQGRALSVKLPPELADRAAEFAEMHASGFRVAVSTLYAALLAAAREEMARSVAAEARRLDPSPDLVLSLVSFACWAEQRRAEHHAWLDAPEVRDGAQTAAVREQLETSNQKKT
jgi:hypothetical protein